MVKRHAELLRRATVGLWVVSTTTAAVAIGCYLAARRAIERGERELVLLTDDVIRASQAKVAAERMVAVGRAYLLAHEPDLLARAQAAETKLDVFLQSVSANPHSGEEQATLARLAAAARRYHDAFAVTVTSGSTSTEPSLLAEALRQQLLPARDGLESELDRLIDQEERRSTTLRAGEREVAWRSTLAILPVAVTGAFGSALCAWIIAAYARRIVLQELDPEPPAPDRNRIGPDREAPGSTPLPASDRPLPGETPAPPRRPTGGAERRRFPGEPTWWPPS